MNVNDPIAPLGGLNIDAVDSMAHRHLATDFELRHGIPPRNEGLIAANDTRDRAQEARAGLAAIRHHRGGQVPEHRAIPTLSPGVCTCVRCGKPVRTAGGGLHPVHADPRTPVQPTAD